ncbi:MAG TPA: Rrf2 family transcriptional regulator [Humisphaera sp.]|jgi:Rrf2 family protein|nr:Rrf2 family transcriptional regulator [Humisphaera sp.]
MAASTRFSVGVHILTLLAHEDGRALTSDYIAGSVNTNPVVIRRMLALLGKAGLVTSTEGAGGGSTLAKRPERIALADVYRAVDPGTLFAESRSDPNPLCPVGRSVHSVLRRHVEQFETRLEKEMDEVTIADVLKGVRSPARK